MNKRVAVIGAGPSGTAVLRAFQSAKEKGARIPEIVCFDKQEDFGGLWNYTWRTGLDEYGEPVHCSMYRYLWSNGPKECLEFADYTFDEHFRKPIASYPPREVLADYIKGRMERAGVRGWCRFRSPVRWVFYDESAEQFTVAVHDLVDDRIYTETFDYVICASGHFSTPNVPFFEGLDRFNGRVLHAHDFRDALEFKGQDVMVVGRSYSAEDIGSQCWKYGANSITVCFRSAPLTHHLPDNWDQRPLLQSVRGKTCHFTDGTKKDVDAIILCTGYLHHFPFMPDGLRLKTGNRLWTKNLWKGVVWEDNPKLLYMGMQDQFYTFNMFDAQAWYVRDVILGRLDLPGRIDMQKHDKPWEDREAALETDEDMICFQGDYTRMLIEATDYPSFDIDGVNETFMDWERHKHENLMTYRDHAHRSLMTGTMSPMHHTPWVDALNDSMEDFLQGPLEKKSA